MKLLNKIKQKIKSFNLYKNPFYHWWKVRKYFKFYRKSYSGKYGWIFGDYFSWNKKKFVLATSALGYKWKYDSARFEHPPFFLLKIGNWHFRIIYGPIEESHIYWETILMFLDKEHDYSLYNCVESNTWESLNSDTKLRKRKNAYTLNMLTKAGKKLYEKELKHYYKFNE